MKKNSTYRPTFECPKVGKTTLFFRPKHTKRWTIRFYKIQFEYNISREYLFSGLLKINIKRTFGLYSELVFLVSLFRMEATCTVELTYLMGIKHGKVSTPVGNKSLARHALLKKIYSAVTTVLF